MDTPRVAVVTSAFGRQHLEWTQQWLDSVVKTSYSNWSVHIVDDGGELSDELHISPPLPDVVVTKFPKQPSISSAFNLAIEEGLKSDPAYVILLTTSTRPTQKDWVSKLIERAEANPGVGIVGTRNVNADGSLNHGGMVLLRNNDMLFGFHVGREVERGMPTASTERLVEAVTGACLLLTRELLDKRIRFDPRIRQNSNDVDLCLQAREQGLAVLYTPAVTMWREEGHSRDGTRTLKDHWDDSRVLASKWHGRRPAW